MPDESPEQFIARLPPEKREILYKLIERWPEIERVTDYSKARAIIIDFVIKAGSVLGALSAGLTFLFIFKGHGGGGAP